MIFEQLNDGPCKTYLIADGGEAMLVDPVLERVDGYLEDIEQLALRLRYVVDTHVHADHISGSAAVRDRTGCDFVMHRRSASACANVRVDDGDVLGLGKLTIGVMHTPGHTQDSISLVMTGRVLTGDYLFIGEGGAGRTDLPGGDAAEHWHRFSGSRRCRTIPSSFQRMTTTAVSTRRSARSAATIRAWQSARATSTWRGSIRSSSGRPTGMADVIKANYACALDPGAAWIPVDQPSCEVKGTAGSVNAQLVETITVDELMHMMAGEDEPLVIDVRERGELDGELGHIPGVLHIALGTLAKRLSALEIYKQRDIVTVCRSGGRSSTAAAIFTVAGFPNVYSLEGGMVAYDAHHSAALAG